MARVGRPRTKSLTHNELVALGKELIEWLEAHPEANHVSDFYSCVKGIYSDDWDLYIRKPEFVPYYDRALKIVRKNYLSGKVPPAIANRFLRLYFKDLKQEEDESKRFEASLKANDAQLTEAAVVEGFDKVMGQLDRLQKKEPS